VDRAARRQRDRTAGIAAAAERIAAAKRGELDAALVGTWSV